MEQNSGRFKLGHKINFERVWTKESRNKLSKTNKGKHHSLETEFKKGKLPQRDFSENRNEFLKIINLGNKYCEGYKHSQERKDKIRKANLGKHHTEETKRKLRETKLKQYQNPDFICNNKEWKEKRINAVIKGLLKRPTSFEQKISNLCFKYNLPFVYKGNGDFLINFKNPDFVNETDKIVIEVFYSYFKIRDYGNVENYKEFCRKKYNSAGWRVIFIDENDLNSKNWEEVCLNKINSMEVLQ